MALAWNRNLVLAIIAQLLSGAGTSICFFVLLSPLLYLLTGTFIFVGYAEGANGLLGALVTFPAGWVADKLTRSTVARTGLTLKLLAYLLMALCVWFAMPAMEMYWILFALLALEGMGDGISNASLQTLLSDSTRTGDRSVTSSLYSGASSLGSVVGPLCAIALLMATGRESWTLEDMRWPWTGGLGLRVLACVAGMFMSDAHTLGAESDDVGKERAKRGEVYKCCCFSSERHVPYLLVAADMLSGLASGMTIKFFPIWLEQSVGLSPVQLNAVSAGQFLCIAVVVTCAQRLARRVGRVQVMLGVKLVSFCFFVAIIVGDGRYWNVQALIATLHVLRSALSPSILGDYVDKTHRARWQAMDMITAFGWSGSSLLGAWMLGSFKDHHPFSTLFMMTLGMQALATVPVWVLGFLVPRKEQSIEEVRSSGGAELKTDPEETQSLLTGD